MINLKVTPENRETKRKLYITRIPRELTTMARRRIPQVVTMRRTRGTEKKIMTPLRTRNRLMSLKMKRKRSHRKKKKRKKMKMNRKKEKS